MTTDASTGSGFNRYAYAANNPFKYVDPDGRAIETAVDVISLGLSVAAYKSDPSFMNGVGVAYDAVATVVPFLPAGFGIIKSAGNVADALKSTTKVEKTASGKWVEDFTPKDLKGAKAENATANGGAMACTDCGRSLESIGSKSGVPTPANQAQVHHEPAISKGGTRATSEKVVVCPECHKARHKE